MICSTSSTNREKTHRTRGYIVAKPADVKTLPSVVSRFRHRITTNMLRIDAFSGGLRLATSQTQANERDRSNLLLWVMRPQESRHSRLHFDDGGP